MMIVGKEQVGKTSLVREICGRSPNSKLHLSFVTGQAKLERTDGIDICQWPPPPTSIAKFCTFPPSAGGAAGGIGGPIVEAVLEEKKPAKGRGQHNYMYSIWDFAGTCFLSLLSLTSVSLSYSPVYCLYVDVS